MKRSILTIFAVLLTLGVQAQDDAFGISLKAYSPQAAFNQNVDNTPFGLSFSYLNRVKDTRFSWGGEFGVAMYSNDSYDIEFGGRPITIDEEDCFFTLHSFVRYDLVRTQIATIYSEARLGLTTFFSTTDAREEDTGFRGEFDFHGTAFNTGVGAGLLVNTGALFSKERVRNRTYIDMAVNVHSGSRARYRMLPEGQGMHTLDDGNFTSLTHYVGYRLGVVIEFD